MDALATTHRDVLLSAGIEAIYAGVDWISASLPSDAPGLEGWELACIHALKQVELGGERVEARTLNGYSGWYAGGCFCGSREGGSYVQLAGHWADSLFDAVSRDDLHISRLDMQATVKYRVYAPGVGKAVYQKSFDANEAIISSRRRKMWYIEGNDGGYTAYLGAPSAEQRGRVYNKAVQSSKPEYDRCWRWEVMGRNEHAMAWYRAVSRETEGRAMLCARMVASWYALRGAQPEWTAFIPLIALPLIKEVPSDADKKLRWLREQVRPAITWLLAAGFTSEVYEALGME